MWTHAHSLYNILFFTQSNIKVHLHTDYWSIDDVSDGFCGVFSDGHWIACVLVGLRCLHKWRNPGFSVNSLEWFFLQTDCQELAIKVVMVWSWCTLWVAAGLYILFFYAFRNSLGIYKGLNLIYCVSCRVDFNLSDV